MVIRKLKQRAALREKLAQLELAIETELPQELSALPEQYGFANIKDFIAAVQATASKGAKRGRKAGRPKRRAAAVAKSRARKRAVITDAVRARVKKLVKSGKPGSAIAKAVGISLPSVQNIKKALGLVKSRGAKPGKARKKPAKKPVPKKTVAKKAPAGKARPPAPPAIASSAV